jgi:hypothetical protein
LPKEAKVRRREANSVASFAGCTWWRDLLSKGHATYWRHSDEGKH